MKKYILPVIFLLQALILSLCLTGFTLLKDAFLETEEVAIASTTDLAPSIGLVSPSKELAESRNRGKELFNANCTTCHSLSRKITGPSLKDICDKYPGEEDKQWLSNWIRNSPKMIFVDKDPRAIALWEANNKVAMNPFPFFTDKDIVDLLEYIQPGCYDN